MDRPDEDELTRAVIELATQDGRYGYRRITALLRNGGWQVGKDRVRYCQVKQFGSILAARRHR